MSFGLRLLFSYLLMFVLVIAHLNYLYIHTFLFPLESYFIFAFFKKDKAEFLKTLVPSLLVVFCSTTLLYSCMFKKDSVVGGLDEFFSWGRWASELSRSQLPQLTRHYPQLLPTTLSVMLKFTEPIKIDFFFRSAMPLCSFKTPEDLKKSLIQYAALAVISALLSAEDTHSLAVYCRFSLAVSKSLSDICLYFINFAVQRKYVFGTKIEK